jgi:NADH dehydrogenase/NADH:ubiquinone oxidoreductase subunit G
LDSAYPIREDAFLVVQASYESSLTERADVVLPMAIWSERSGTFTNLEGKTHHAHRAVAAVGEAKADWEILWLLAEVMGKVPASSLEELGSLATADLL